MWQKNEPTLLPPCKLALEKYLQPFLVDATIPGVFHVENENLREGSKCQIRKLTRPMKIQQKLSAHLYGIPFEESQMKPMLRESNCWLAARRLLTNSQASTC